MWIVFLEESGEEKSFNTKKEAETWIREIKAFDKRNNIVGEVYTLYYEEDGE